MEIQLIRCAVPCCARAEEEQTKCSFITRITAVVLGTIALLVGIFVLSGIPGLSAFGTIGGALLTVIGSLILLTGICLRCIKDGEIEIKLQQANQNTFDYVDQRAGSYSSGGSSTDHTGKTTTNSESYCTLENFLASPKSNDIAVRERVTKALGIDDLEQRAKENFFNKKVSLALLIKCENDVRDDELLFQLLKLIYLPLNELFNLPLDEIKTFDDEKKNILCLRLMLVDTAPQCGPGTLGAFLGARAEILAGTLPLDLYSFFTKEQVIFLLQNAKKIDSKLVKALFPSPQQQPFIATRSTQFLSELPIEYIHKILPYLSGQLLWPLMQIRGKELNYSLCTDEQVNEMLPSSFMDQSKSAQKMETLSIETLNSLLPKMHYQLRFIPDKHLKDNKLNLNPLTEDQVSNMFPASFMEQSKSQERMSRLHINVLNQILPKMSSGQLQLVPDNHLSNSGLNIKALPQNKISGMFPASFMEQNKSKKRMRALANDNLNYVKSIVKFNDS